MLSKETLAKIENLAMQVAEREGCKLYDLQFMGGSSGRTLRVFIDKQGGASVDDCANVSRGLNLLLDVEDPIPGGAYHLEVSTPGVERVLKKNWHYQEAKGQKIWVRISESLGNFGAQDKKLSVAKQISEVLSEVTDAGIQFQIGEDHISIPFGAIEKAHVVFDFENNKQAKGIKKINK